MSTKKHVHTYIRYRNNRYNRDDLFKCNDPHCQHFADREFILGKASICTMCGSEFILDRDDLKRSRPRCVKCSNTKSAQRRRALTDLIDSVLPKEIEI